MSWSIRMKDRMKSYLQRILGITQLQEQITLLSECVIDRERVADLQYQDLLILLKRQAGASIGATEFAVETDHRVAVMSDDHRFPRGTIFDNTRSPRFVAASERIFGSKLSFLDLGCAGGGLVWDFLIRDHIAIGLEGSDISFLSKRAEWRHLPNNLFTCDITKPFRTLNESKPYQFDVITAWEALEHIGDADLPSLITNIREHLSERGMFIGSVNTLEQVDESTGANYHVSVHPREWWIEKFRANGMVVVDNPPFAFADYCRGTGNGRLDGDYRVKNDGFHLVAKRSQTV